MSNPAQPEPRAEATATRRPRLAFMGEFSAGKSTLTNLLLGSNPLPMKVTATQLPPVWLTYGEAGAVREDLEGNVTPLDMNDLSDVVPEETRVILVSLKADILELCDLIDMPGISDPNMSPDIWQRVVDQADLVVWCTHATQAWRQSEAAVWSSLDADLYSKSLLLLTRFDKLLSEDDRGAGPATRSARDRRAVRRLLPRLAYHGRRGRRRSGQMGGERRGTVHDAPLATAPRGRGRA
jgi:hypothetical protein